MKLLGQTSSLSDQELIELYKKKLDQKYLAEFFTRYTHLLMGVCMKYLKNEELAKDAVMSLYESLAEKLQSSVVQNAGAWIYVVTKNHCIGILRKQTRLDTEQKKFVENVEFELGERPLVDYSLEEQLVALEECIEELNKEQGKCVGLFYLKKKSYQEITNLTGYTLKNVKSYLQNGKRNLKICIENKIEAQH
ncbi:MAG: sigma-70 family RNA polymerase sigma factor [Cyclobacteriaceae bacterium]|nr:sigma-70 family RNA polymerase sigma factor [Cyclobacteriaceae bacterium]